MDQCNGKTSFKRYQLELNRWLWSKFIRKNTHPSFFKMGISTLITKNKKGEVNFFSSAVEL
jgi:hypothetical protein